jgi:predicted transcriptional regulator
MRFLNSSCQNVFPPPRRSWGADNDVHAVFTGRTWVARRDLATKIGLGRKRKQDAEGEQASEGQGGAQQAPSPNPRPGRRPKSS